MQRPFRWVLGIGSSLIEDVNTLVTKWFINKHKTFFLLILYVKQNSLPRNRLSYEFFLKEKILGLNLRTGYGKF